MGTDARMEAMVNKYNNKKTTLDGITFDSKKEAKRYSELLLLQRAREIELLRLQPEYELIVNGTKVGKYIADFAYVDTDGREVVEDVKGGNATKTAVYRLKKKLVKALYGIEVQEV